MENSHPAHTLQRLGCPPVVLQIRGVQVDGFPAVVDSLNKLPQLDSHMSAVPMQLGIQNRVAAIGSETSCEVIARLTSARLCALQTGKEHVE